MERTDDKRLIRRMGKLSEECSELVHVASRITIQGLDEMDPSSGKPNRQRLLEELADVQAQINCTLRFLEVGDDGGSAFCRRTIEKMQQMDEWEELVSPAVVKPFPFRGCECNACRTARLR